MKYPNLNQEKKLWQQGFKCVVGLDEAGRGPLAGPVVAACVNLKSILNDKILKNVKDSKKLSEKQRERFYKILTNYPQIEWGVGIVSEKVIDKINILEATKLAMRKALSALGRKFCRGKIFCQPDFLILDGNFALQLPQRPNFIVRQKAVVAGDQKVFSCAAASIIAKVTRDRIMIKYHKKYPQYNFAKHKGYPTQLHKKMLRKFGHCPIHRKSFRF